MVAVAAIAMAVAANAGTVSWGIQCVVDPVSGDDFSGGIAYLFNNADVEQSLIAASILDGTFATKFADSALYPSEFDSGEVAETKILKGEIDGMQTLYSVVLDSESNPAYFFVTDTQTLNVPSSGDRGFNWEMTSEKSDWTAVPEPTSGLLLLLGVAGLALRRRRA